MDSRSHGLERGSRRNVNKRSAEFDARPIICLWHRLSWSPLPTAAVRRVSHHACRVNQCTGSAMTAHMRPLYLTARGCPAGENRTSTATSRAGLMAVAVMAVAFALHVAGSTLFTPPANSGGHASSAHAPDAGHCVQGVSSTTRGRHGSHGPFDHVVATNRAARRQSDRHPCPAHTGQRSSRTHPNVPAGHADGPAHPHSGTPGWIRASSTASKAAPSLKRPWCPPSRTGVSLPPSFTETVDRFVSESAVTQRAAGGWPRGWSTTASITTPDGSPG